MLAWPSMIAVGVLAAVHLLVGFVLPNVGPRQQKWFSLAGGIAVAYVFVHVLPDLSEHQAAWLEQRPDRPWLWFQHQIYVGALGGLLLAYGLDQISRDDDIVRFWVRIASFSLYNTLVGYYVVQIQQPVAIVLATIGLGAHFLSNDRELLREGAELYQGAGRLVLAASVIVGGLLGRVMDLPEPVLSVAFAVLAGGIILHALNEEVPRESDGRFGYFAFGAIAFTVLILAFEGFKH